MSNDMAQAEPSNRRYAHFRAGGVGAAPARTSGLATQATHVALFGSVSLWSILYAIAAFRAVSPPPLLRVITRRDRVTHGNNLCAWALDCRVTRGNDVNGITRKKLKLRHYPLFAALALFCLALSASEPRAQLATSYITPFPKGEAYELFVLGDSLADGLWDGLAAQLSDDPEVRVSRKSSGAAGFTGRSYERWRSYVARLAEREEFEIAVIIAGVYDRRSIRLDGVRYFMSAPEWQREYGKRVDQLISLLKHKGVAIYWVGLPVMRGGKASYAAQITNGIIRERALRNGIKFIETWNAFIDQSGGYTDYGPDLNGEIRRLRTRDGIHFTSRGYRKLAQIVARVIRRDLALAKAERKLPLAGDEEELKRLRERLAREKERLARRAQALGGADRRGRGRAVRSQNSQTNSGLGSAIEYKAASSKVRLPAGKPGRSPVEITIVRPAIPAAVVSHIRRRSRSAAAASFGRPLPVGLEGGAVVLGTVATSDPSGANGVRRSVPVTQTPYYKVLVKGETLPPKPGRADDFRWPRYRRDPAG